MKKKIFKESLAKTIKEIGNGSKVRGITLIALTFNRIVLSKSILNYKKIIKWS